MEVSEILPAPLPVLEIQLENALLLVTVIAVLPNNFTPVLVVTQYVESLDLETLFVPYVLLQPEITHFHGHWEHHDLNFNTYENAFQDTHKSFQFSGKRLRSMMLFYGNGNGHSEYGDVLSGKCWKFYPDDKSQSTEIQCYPNPFIYHEPCFGPIVVVLFQERTEEAGYARRDDTFVRESFMGHMYTQRHQPMIFFMEYTASNLSSPAFYSSTFCLACSGSLHYEWRYSTEEPPMFFWKAQPAEFKCATPSGCWEQMVATAHALSNGGEQIIWGDEEGALETNRFLAADYRAFERQKVLLNLLELHDQMILTLLPTQNTTIKGCVPHNVPEDELDRVLYECQTFLSIPHKITVWKTDDFNDTFVFVTDQNVTSTRSAANLYLNVFDVPSWISIAVVGFLSSVALAALLMKSIDNLMTLLENFAQVFTYFGAYFLDQCPTSLPFSETDIWRRSVMLSVVVPWMMAILILSSGFRGVLKSNFANKFDFHTNMNNWQLYMEDNFSLFNFHMDAECINQTASAFVDERWIWWLANGKPEKLRCFSYETSAAIQPELPRQRLQSSQYKRSRFYEWIQAHTEKLGLPADIYEHPVSEQEIFIRDLIKMRLHVQHICPGNFSEFSGAKYHENVAYWRNYTMTGPANWNFTSLEFPSVLKACDRGNYTTRIGIIRDADVHQAYWMTRSHKSAFVIRRSDFPWYWNLFKVAMTANGSTVKYAHTGGADLTKKGKKALFERNDAPFYIYIKERYFEPTEWFSKRLAGIQQSGIMNLWYKWDMILRPPRYEPLKDEVSEVYDEVRALRLEDPGIAFLLYIVTVTIVIASVVFFAEIIWFMLIDL